MTLLKTSLYLTELLKLLNLQSFALSNTNKETIPSPRGPIKLLGNRLLMQFKTNSTTTKNVKQKNNHVTSCRQLHWIGLSFVFFPVLFFVTCFTISKQAHNAKDFTFILVPFCTFYIVFWGNSTLIVSTLFSFTFFVSFLVLHLQINLFSTILKIKRLTEIVRNVIA